ncbi:MAG: dTDP-4-dehydrorhamnose reductase [Gemmatimonadota bacterium]
MSGTVLVTGASGQLGRELTRTQPAGTLVHALARADLDLQDSAAVARMIDRHRPSVIINAAAYTAVDRAETEARLAHAVNVTAVQALAEAALRCEARIIHVSTDFVFGGGSARPWRTDDATAPQSVYGRTKRDGESALLDTLGARALVMRTAWLYSAHGTNFVTTMLRLLRERESVSVVADQVGTPTWARTLATTIWAAVERPELGGIMHWTDAGVASWYDLAVAVSEDAAAAGLLPRVTTVLPITTEDYPTAATRPSYSVLDKTATLAALQVPTMHWRTALRQMLAEMADA